MPDEANDSGFSTWLLETLFTHEHRSLQPVGSQVIGMLGLIVLAIASVSLGCAGVRYASVAQSMVTNPGTGIIVGAAIASPFIAMIYVAIGITMHVIASCQWPLSFRLAWIYGFLFVCLSIIVVTSQDDQLGGIHVLYLVPFCFGGFIQQWRGWRALSWQQAISPPPMITVRLVMDATAAIALTLAILRIGEFNPRTLTCWVPTMVMFSAAGMHLWGRLSLMCEDDQDHINGRGMWLTGNVLIAAGICVVCVAAGSSTIALCIVILPLIYLAAHCWSALAIGWLKACGWRFERYQEAR